MPHITIQMYPGRDERTKTELAQKIANSLAAVSNIFR